MSTTSEEYDKTNMREHLLSRIKSDDSNLERFEDHTSALPHADAIPDPPPFELKQLFAQHAKEKQQICIMLTKYQQTRIVVQRKLADARQKAQAIGLGTRRIVLDRLRANFSEADAALAAFIELLEKQAKAVETLISRIHGALQRAEVKRWPHGKIDEYPAPMLRSSTEPQQIQSSGPDRGDFRKVLGGLRSLPPTTLHNDAYRNQET
ncbi:MAG: hypothetical protein AMXMBFR84_48180 [Candidatus Hydrogenedentota bacterium]